MSRQSARAMLLLMLLQEATQCHVLTRPQVNGQWEGNCLLDKYLSAVEQYWTPSTATLISKDNGLEVAFKPQQVTNGCAQNS